MNNQGRSKGGVLEKLHKGMQEKARGAEKIGKPVVLGGDGGSKLLT